LRKDARSRNGEISDRVLQKNKLQKRISGAARPTTSSDYPEERFDAGTLRGRLDALANPLLV
jgi:hypothetical protein